MTIKYCVKLFSVIVRGADVVYYSDPSFDATLASAERFLITGRVQASETTTLTVNLETSNDGVNWYAGTTITPSSAVSLSDPLVWWETAEAAVSGGFVRVSVQLGGSSVVGGYVELWVCGRSFY